MKPNFHAIDAIVYGLRSGFSAIPTALRRGWLSWLVVIASTANVFTTLVAYDDLMQGDLGLSGIIIGVVESVTDVMDGIGIELDDETLVIADEDATRIASSLWIYMAGNFVAMILFVPALVDLYRRAAGLEDRPGFLPGFGAPEWSVILSVILIFALGLIAYLIFAFGIAGVIAAAAATDQPLIGVLGGIVAGAALIWFFVRIQLFPIHAALVERVDLGGAFGLVGGRFWKLLGTNILIGFVVAVIQIGISLLDPSLLLGSFLDMKTAVAGSLVLSLLLTFYTQVATASAYGRITSDLMGLTDSGFGAPAEEAAPDGGSEPDDAPEVVAEEADETVNGDAGDAGDAGDSSAGDTVQRAMMTRSGERRRSSLDFVRTRLRG